MRIKVNEQTVTKERKNNIKFIPDTKIIDNHTDVINNACPKSGWDKSRIIVGNKTTILIKYLKYRLFLSIDIINDIIITKNGFKVSIGWNLGNVPISNHLFEPFTSIPIMGTKNNVMKLRKNNTIDRLINNFWSNKENIKIIRIPKVTKTRCFKKK